MAKHISWKFKCKFNNTTCKSNKKWNNKTCHCECKNYHTCVKDYSCNSSTCICENSKYLKSIADTSVIACDEIIFVMDIISTKMNKYYSNKYSKTFSSDNLVLHGPEKYDAIYNKTRCLISLNSGIAYIFFSLFF